MAQPEHAYYSKKQSALTGTHFYADEQGNEVEITEVSDSYPSNAGWDDMEYRGLVYQYLRRGQPRRTEHDIIDK